MKIWMKAGLAAAASLLMTGCITIRVSEKTEDEGQTEQSEVFSETLETTDSSAQTFSSGRVRSTCAGENLAAQEIEMMFSAPSANEQIDLLEGSIKLSAADLDLEEIDQELLESSDIKEVLAQMLGVEEENLELVYGSDHVTGLFSVSGDKNVLNFLEEDESVVVTVDMMRNAFQNQFGLSCQ